MDELYHYGILGQKWRIRKYQNEDGTLNEAGKKRYWKDTNRIDKYLSKSEKKFDKISKRIKVVSKHLNRKSNEKKMEKIKKDLLKAIKYSEKAKKLVSKLEHKYKKVMG